MLAQIEELKKPVAIIGAEVPESESQNSEFREGWQALIEELKNPVAIFGAEVLKPESQNSEFQEGWQAFYNNRCGKPHDLCPYHQVCHEWLNLKATKQYQWYAGWYKAKNQYND